MSSIDAGSTGLAYQLRALSTFVRRDMKLWTYFKVNLLVDLLGVFSNLVIYAVIARFNPGGEGMAAYNHDYVAFVVIGLVFNTLLSTALSGPYMGVMDSFWNSRLEVLIMSPVSLPVFTVGLSAGQYVRALFRVAIYLGGGALLFGLRFPAGADLPAAALVLFLAVVACTGLGLMAASMIYIVDARGGSDPVRLVVENLAGVAAGVYFPVQVLPVWVQWLAGLVPHTYALDGIRQALLGGGTPLPTLPLHRLLPALSPVLTDALALAVYSALALPLGWAMFKRGLRLAKVDGRLSRWV